MRTLIIDINTNITINVSIRMIIDSISIIIIIREFRDVVFEDVVFDNIDSA